MDIQRSRNGFYTLTFLNKTNLPEEVIHREFSTVGKVCSLVQNSNRVFVRYLEKDEAERAIIKFGNVYDVDMAKNKHIENPNPEGGYRHNFKGFNKQNPIASSASDISSSSQTLDKAMSSNKNFYLILGNLPKNYTIKDVSALVEEANPSFISPFEETRVFRLRFCYIILKNYDNLLYLTDKLNGFVICGEKLIAVESKNLLEWREKMC